MKRWAINIDIEGFGETYDTEPQAMISLRALMDGIFRIGSRCYSTPPERIFAHQLGDGFIIIGDFGSEQLDKPVAIAIALMQHVLAKGGATKVAISEGDFADVQGCYPESIREADGRSGAVYMGSGLMTIFPVMGTALINAIRRTNKAPSGSLLIAHKSFSSRIPKEIVSTTIQEQDLISVDWIHSDLQTTENIQKSSGLSRLGVQKLESAMIQYLTANNLPLRWKANTRLLLNL